MFYIENKNIIFVGFTKYIKSLLATPRFRTSTPSKVLALYAVCRSPTGIPKKTLLFIQVSKECC